MDRVTRNEDDQKNILCHLKTGNLFQGFPNAFEALTIIKL